MSDETTEAVGRETAPEKRTPVVRTVEGPAGQRAHAAVLALRVPTKLDVDVFVVGRSDAGACVTPGMVLARDQRFLLRREATGGLRARAACSDLMNAAEPRKRKAPGVCSCCMAAEIQTPVGTHDKSTCPLNPDASAAPKPKDPKRPRSDSLPYHLLGSCSRASNRPETRGPIIRPGIALSKLLTT